MNQNMREFDKNSKPLNFYAKIGVIALIVGVIGYFIGSSNNQTKYLRNEITDSLIHDKLSNFNKIIDGKTYYNYRSFESRRAALIVQKGDLSQLNIWKEKAEVLQKRTISLVSLILSETNDMIKTAEGEDWVKYRSYDNIVELYPIYTIRSKDNREIPTQLFIGKNPYKPNVRSLSIIDSIHQYRDWVCETMATYNQFNKQFYFHPPADISGLSAALKTVNPMDTSQIAKIYRSMTHPETITIQNDQGQMELPWVSALLYNTSISEAIIIFACLQMDVLAAENMVTEYFLDKIAYPFFFNFTKIEPFAYSKKNYVAVGEPTQLKVVIAAYDSTEVSTLRYGINEPDPNKWVDVEGDIPLLFDTPGTYDVTGYITIRERGQYVHRPWSYTYTVIEK